MIKDFFYNRNDFKEIQNFFDGNKDKEKIIITFTHGWNHNCAEGDSNLNNFRESLIEIYNKLSIKKMVVGIFIAWQGNSYKIFDNKSSKEIGFISWFNRINLLSFWNRQQRILTISQGSMRELIEYVNLQKNPISDVIVHIGHSFGGFMLFYARSHSIMRYIMSDAEPDEDMLICLNPAFSAIRFLPIFDAFANNSIKRTRESPFFVSITSESDKATKIWFPIGNFLALILQGFTNKIQRKCLYSTIGHRKELITHVINYNNKYEKTEKVSNFNELKEYKGHDKNIFSSGIRNIKCDANFISDHNDIFNTRVAKYITNLVLSRISER